MSSREQPDLNGKTLREIERDIADGFEARYLRGEVGRFPSAEEMMSGMIRSPKPSDTAVEKESAE